MTKHFVRVLTLVAVQSVLTLMVCLTGCVGKRDDQTTDQGIEDSRTGKRYNQTTGQGIEDSRTAELVREALAAGIDYKYDRVKVVSSDGVVQLNGFVSTSAQKQSAGEIAGKVAGVKSVENNLAVKPGEN